MKTWESWRICIPLLGLALLLLAGCKASTTGGSGPDAMYLSPDYQEMKLTSLAYLGTASVGTDPAAVRTMDRLLRSYLTGGQERFLIVGESTIRSRAADQGATEDLDRIIRTWKDRLDVDQLALQSFGERVGIDGFLFADLTNWREERVDWTDEGNSFTEVGLALSIYDARTGEIAWKGQKMVREESRHYRHSRGGGSGVYSEGVTERTERADKIVPPPPPAEEVAEKAIQELIKGLPEKPGAES
ncbi:MAG: hypothetical protein GF346_02460 [Candidatus Eisenbacteria bacterium]|nr:hypothetical protein [Candidatus Latescibacterota bacterium]MBD3301287.1 hypothetical protein [Candidatus Eisenbacteria bacterium]